MTGPEHVARAETLIQLSLKQYEKSAVGDDALAALTMAQAQVHATLAHTALLAEQGMHDLAWERVFS